MIKFLLFYSHKPHLYYKSKLVYSQEILSCNIKVILEYDVLPHPLFSLGGGGGVKEWLGGKRVEGDCRENIVELLCVTTSHN